MDCLYPLIDALKGYHGAVLEADIAWSEVLLAQVPPPGAVLLLTLCMPASSQDPQGLPSQRDITACCHTMMSLPHTAMTL